MVKIIFIILSVVLSVLILNTKTDNFIYYEDIKGFDYYDFFPSFSYEESTSVSLKELEEKSDLVLKVKLVDYIQFYSNKQYAKVEVIEVYKDNKAIKATDKINIRGIDVQLIDQVKSCFVGISGIMDYGQEYIIFLNTTDEDNYYKFTNINFDKFPISDLRILYMNDDQNKGIEYIENNNYNLIITNEGYYQSGIEKYNYETNKEEHLTYKYNYLEYQKNYLNILKDVIEKYSDKI